MKKWRQWLNKHSPIITVVSVVVLILASGWIVQEGLLQWRRSASVPDAWFYDLGTGQLFRAKGNLLPPIDAPSGPLPNGESAGVRAKVFAFGDCADPSNRFIGWLEKLNPEVKYSIVHEGIGTWYDYSPTDIAYVDGLLVRSVNGEYWYKATSDAGRKLFQVPREKCPPGVVLHSCFPQ